MTYKPSFWYSSETHYAQGFTPVVVHVDAAGNVRLPGSSNAPVPPGFQRQELTNIRQIRQFEQKMNAVEDARAQDHSKNRVRNLNGQLQANREAMKELVSRFTPRGQRFYEAMREASERRQKAFESRNTRSSNFHIEAFSMDSSNRDGYRDGANNWGRMHGSGK